MDPDKRFLIIAGTAAILTALTTIGVHYVTFPADTFEQRLQLIHHTGYIAHRWMIIFHCLFVITSMLGLALIRHRQGGGLMYLGFVFYVVFGVTEMARMFGVLHYLNTLRGQYTGTTDEMTQTLLHQSIDQFTLTGNTLFALFSFAFGIGNLCYGIVFSTGKGVSRWIGYAFVYWALASFLGLVNHCLQWSWVDSIHEFNGKVFQPVFRMILGVWIFRQVARFS